MSHGVISFPLDQLSARDDFVFDPDQPLARAALDALIEDEIHCNPVVIFGPTGTGKTALANCLLERWLLSRAVESLDLKPVVVNATDFCRGFSQALDTNGIAEFRAKYRETDFLVIDELHRAIGKRAALSELLFTIDELVALNRWVVVTIDKSPTEHKALPPELSSRLSMGLSVPLGPPGPVVKEHVLLNLVNRFELPLSTESKKLIIDRSVNIAQLRRVVNELCQAREDNQTLDDHLIDRLTGIQKLDVEIDLAKIARSVARHFQVKVADLRSPSRRQNVVRARGIAMLLSRQLTSKSLEEIGSHYGGRDHTTVLHACRKTETVLSDEPALRQSFDEIELYLNR